MYGSRKPMTFTTRPLLLVPGRGWRVLLAAILLPVTASCSDTIVTPTNVATVRVVPEQVAVTEGGTVQLSAELRDEAGRTVTGHPVTWSSTDDGIASVDAAGRISAKIRGTTSVHARVGAAQGTATVQVLLPPFIALSQNSVSLITGSDGAAPSPIQVAITNGGEAELTGLAVERDYGGGPTGWLSTSLPQTSAPAILTVGAMDIGGLAPGRYEATVHISASSAPGDPVPLLVSLEVRGSTGGAEPPGSPSSAVLTGPASVAAGLVSEVLTLRVVDDRGNTAAVAGNTSFALGSTATGTFYAEKAGNNAITSVTIPAGDSTASFYYSGAVAGQHTLSAANATLGAAAHAITVTVGAAARLTFGQQPTPTTVNAAIAPPVTVRIEDAAGNLVSSIATVTLSLGTNPSGAQLGGTVTRAAVNGVATFDDLSLDRVGSGYTLAATSGSLAGATSNAFDITVGAAARLTFGQQPTPTTVNAAIAPPVTVRIEDEAGNLVSSTATVTLSLGTNPSGAQLGGTVTRAAVNGVATFDDVSLDLAGSGYTLAATSGSLTAATSDAFDITGDGVAAQLVYGQQPTDAVVGSVISPPVTVRIEDKDGNLVIDADLEVTIRLLGNQSLGGTLSVTPIGGIATFHDLTINQVGNNYKLQARAGSLEAVTSQSFEIVAASDADPAFE
jgi:hypothetical protein